MIHQNSKRIETPLQNKKFSMLIDNTSNSLFKSRITQKRKPIFDRTPNKTESSKSSSLRKQIFFKTSKSQFKSPNLHFTKVFQSDQPLAVSGLQEDDIQQYKKKDTLQQSSIQSDDELADIRRKLFPQTPIKKIRQQTEDLDNGRSWLRGSNQNYKNKLFDDSYTPQKPNKSMITKSLYKNIPKLDCILPDKKFKNESQNDSYIMKTQFNLESNQIFKFQTPARFNSLQQPQKDIAQQIRQLHQKMVQNSKISGISQLKLKNQFHQNKNKNFKDTNNLGRISDSQQYRKMANQNLLMKLRIEKVRNTLTNLLDESKVQQQWASQNIQNTIKQVLKQLQI